MWSVNATRRALTFKQAAPFAQHGRLRVPASSNDAYRKFAKAIDTTLQHVAFLDGPDTVRRPREDKVSGIQFEQR